MTDLKPETRVDDQEPVQKSQAEIDRLWLEEAERRLAAYRAGKLETVPAEEIFGDEE